MICIITQPCYGTDSSGGKVKSCMRQTSVKLRQMRTRTMSFALHVCENSPIPVFLKALIALVLRLLVKSTQYRLHSDSSHAYFAVKNRSTWRQVVKIEVNS